MAPQRPLAVKRGKNRKMVKRKMIRKSAPVAVVAFFMMCAAWLLVFGQAGAATGSADVTVEVSADKLTVRAENTPLKKILDSILDAYPLDVRGLEARSDEELDFAAQNQLPEDIFKRLLRQLGETNYAFEFRGERLSRVLVMPESGKPSVSRTSPSPIKEPSSHEDQVSVVRVDRIIDGSQAQDLGIQSDDLVIEYDGEKISQPGELIREVKKKSDNPNVSMVLLRNGTPLHLTLRGGFIGIHIVPHKVSREMVSGYFD